MKIVNDILDFVARWFPYAIVVFAVMGILVACYGFK